MKNCEQIERLINSCSSCRYLTRFAFGMTTDALRFAIWYKTIFLQLIAEALDARIPGEEYLQNNKVWNSERIGPYVHIWFGEYFNLWTMYLGRYDSLWKPVVPKYEYQEPKLTIIQTCSKKHPRTEIPVDTLLDIAMRHDTGYIFEICDPITDEMMEEVYAYRIAYEDSRLEFELIPV